jgi:D-galactarolactone cycloisomerase
VIACVFRPQTRKNAGNKGATVATYLRRRDFLKGLAGLAGAAAAPVPALAQSAGAVGYDNTASHRALAGRAKIKEVVNIPLRVEKDLGSYPDWVGNPRQIQIGGGTYVEVRTDQGVTGIGPGVDPAMLAAVSRILVGQDPCDINVLAERLYGVSAGARGSAGAEIAVWDLIGKMANQPLYKLWGGGRDRVMPYASMLRLSTPRERGQLALKLKGDGWKAIKLRSSFPTMREDVQLVEELRKTCGEDFVIMCDGNKATLNLASTQGVAWDFQRALQTALEYQRLGVYWLEEPLRRFDYEGLARLKSLISMHLAGGEGNRNINEFKDLLDRNCFDVVQPEIMSEGPAHLRKIAVLAEAQNKMCEPHQGDGRLGTICDLHLIASWPNAPYLEIFNDQPIGDYINPFAMFENPILLDKDGYFNLPQGPGLGMTIRKDLIQKT